MQEDIKRNIAITINVINGMTYETAGNQEHVSGCRAKQIVKRILRNTAATLDKDIRRDLAHVRKNKEFWLNLLK